MFSDASTFQNDDILLMEEFLHHLGCIKPYEYWDIPSTGAGFLPSTVSPDQSALFESTLLESMIFPNFP